MRSTSNFQFLQIMGSGISVHIVLQNPSVRSGGTAVGTIFMHVSKPARVSAVRLELTCSEEAGYIGAKKALLNHISIIKSFADDKELFTGHYAYPFTLELPDCPGSFNAPLPDIMPNVKYTISGVVMKGSWTLAKHAINLNVIPSHPATVEPLLETVRKGTKLITSLSTCSRGTVELTVMTDKNIYKGGEPIVATLNIKNETRRTHAKVSAYLCRVFVADGKVYRDFVDTVTLSAIEPGKSMVNKIVNLNIPKEYEYLKAQQLYSGNVHVIYYIEVRAASAVAKIPVHMILPAKGEPNERPNDGENWHPVEHKPLILTVPSFTGSVRYNNERGRPGSMLGGSSFKASTFMANSVKPRQFNAVQEKNSMIELGAPAVDKFKSAEELGSPKAASPKQSLSPKASVAPQASSAKQSPKEKPWSPADAMMQDDKPNNAL